MKIGVIGTGYVGLVSGTCFAELGNDVICVDIDQAKIDQLNQGKIPIYEPGLEELVLRNHDNGRLQFTTDVASVLKSTDIIFSAVGTPPDKDHRADLSAVKAVAKTFGQHIDQYTVFVNKSTVPVGTSETVGEIIVAELKKRGYSDTDANNLFDVVDNPEFLREGAAVKDFLNPDRIVVGVETERAQELLKQLYQPIVRAGRPLIFTDVKSAEVIKYASNSFLATKISFINEMANFCDEVGANVRQVAKGMGMDSRIGPKFLHAGIGYGGSCFPKDVQALIQTGNDHGYSFEILKAVEAVNAQQKRRIIEKLEELHEDLSGLTLAVWGLTFKPKTDDMREAPSLTILPELIERGVTIQAYDPVGTENAKSILGEAGITYGAHRDDVLTGADALLILTEWDEFRGADLAAIHSLLKTPLILDGRNIYDRDEVEAAGFKYVGIGA
jgi:UDPglucose 6-dehydrogenase